MTLELNPKTTALLVMDLQSAILGMIPDQKDAILAPAATLLEAAREAGARVIYVVVGFRAGYPEIPADHPTFGMARESGRFLAGGPGTDIDASIAPRPEEPIVMKHRVSAFHGTDLDLILRANGIQTLVLAGVSTSGVILSTTRHASDADYKVVIAEDACTDPDPEVHRVLCEKVFARQAKVVKTADVVKALS